VIKKLSDKRVSHFAPEVDVQSGTQQNNNNGDLDD